MTRRPWHEVLDDWFDTLDGWPAPAYRDTGPLGWLRSMVVRLAAVALGLVGMILAFILAALALAAVVVLGAMAVLLVARFIGL